MEQPRYFECRAPRLVLDSPSELPVKCPCVNIALCVTYRQQYLTLTNGQHIHVPNICPHFQRAFRSINAHYVRNCTVSLIAGQQIFQKLILICLLLDLSLSGRNRDKKGISLIHLPRNFQESKYLKTKIENNYMKYTSGQRVCFSNVRQIKLIKALCFKTVIVTYS